MAKRIPPRPGGPPRLGDTRPLVVHLTENIRSALEKEVKVSRLSMNEITRRALEQYLKLGA